MAFYSRIAIDKSSLAAIGNPIRPKIQHAYLLAEVLFG